MISQRETTITDHMENTALHNYQLLWGDLNKFPEKNQYYVLNFDKTALCIQWQKLIAFCENNYQL